jgi:oligosaccharide repeat unit polymerase
MSAYALTLIVLGVLPPLLLFLAARLDRGGDIVHPLTVIAWTFVIAYGLKSVYLAYAVDAEVPFRTREQSGDILYIGQLIVLVAATSMIVGYFMMARKGFRTAPPRRQRNTLFWTSVYWAVFALCLAGMVQLFVMKGLHIQLTTLQFTTAKYYIDEDTGERSSLGFLLISADILVVCFLYYLANGGKFLRINPYTLAIAFVCLTYFLSSQRTGVLNILICVLIMSRQSLFDFRSRAALKRLALLATVIPVLSVASNIREERREVSASELSILAGLESTANHVFEGFYALDPIKITMIARSEEDHMMGESFIMFLVAPIPRLIWPEKPSVRLGPYVGQALLDFNNNSGAPPSAIGEFYINFGMTGVVLGMFLMGVLLKIVHSTYAIAPNPVFSRVRYALAVMIFVHFLIADFSYAILFVFKYGIGIFLCEKYWSTRLAPRSNAVPARPTPQNLPAIDGVAGPTHQLP